MFRYCDENNNWLEVGSYLLIEQCFVHVNRVAARTSRYSERFNSLNAQLLPYRSRSLRTVTSPSPSVKSIAAAYIGGGGHRAREASVR